ncbi:hypothetical protein GCM10022376_18510 [Yimella lutea]
MLLCLPSPWLPYWRLFVARIRQQATSRLAMVGGLIANATFGFLKTAILSATVVAGGGTGMRAEVAAALLHSPELVILDEPTIGLDVLSKQRLRDFLIAERAQNGTTLLLTTHDMGDIERLCDRVLVVDHGKLAYDGRLPGLSARVGAQRVLVLDLADAGPDLLDIPKTQHMGSEADGMRQRLAFDPAATTAAALLAAVGERAEVRDLTIEEPDIEDVVRRIYLAQRT